MIKIISWSVLMLFMVVLTSHAETTTDNLLDNGDFSTGDLSGWTVEDSGKIQYDGQCYSSSGLCQSVRWSTDLGKTLSQTIEDLSEGYDIDTIHLDFTALGCNNEATGAWCSQGTDYDKVQAVIQLSDGTNTENLYLEQTLDYNDGTKDYGLSTQTLDAWTTDDTSINFSVTGIDTGDWSGQYGPIVDNLSLYLTMTETVVPIIVEPIVVEPIVVEPIVVEPIVVEPIVVEPIVETVIEPIIENTVIEGLSLDTEIVTDVIIDTPVQPEVPVNNLPELPDLPSVEIEIPTVIEVPQEIEIVEEIPEIQEIEVEEVAEVTEEVVEQPEELKETDMEEDLAEAEEVEETESSEEEEKAESEEETEVAESKDEPKPQAKPKPKQSKSQVSEAPKKNTGIEQVDISTMIGLQVIPQTITIQETVSLTQEMIYEQDIGALASSDAYDSLIGSSSSRWVRMVDVRPKHSFSGYGR